MLMEWNWMVGGSVWIIPSQREHTHPLQAFTWAGQPSKMFAYLLVVFYLLAVLIEILNCCLLCVL